MKTEITEQQATEFYQRSQKRSHWGWGLEALAALLFILGIVLMLLFWGCTTRNEYTTLASTERAVVLSYDGYVDSVISGQSRTNELPTIAKGFDLFQASFRTAVDAASGNTNAPVTGDISTKAAALIQQITTAKSQPKK